jgi:uncharacterized protein YutE (UPF0331/DUF86 family)
MQHEYNEVNARALMRLLEQRVDAVGVLIEGPRINGELRPSTLSKMLADGKYPATESKALQDAYDALVDAMSDMMMSLCMPFDIARNDVEDAVRKARELGVAHL